MLFIRGIPQFVKEKFKVERTLNWTETQIGRLKKEKVIKTNSNKTDRKQKPNVEQNFCHKLKRTNKSDDILILLLSFFKST